MEKIIYYQRDITVEEFIKIRRTVDWDIPPKEAIETGLENTLFSVCAEQGEEIVGYGRIVGDGGLVLYIQDVIVKPEYQSQGIGTKIMKKIMRFIRQNYSAGIMVCLMSAKGKEDFYSKFGFMERPNESYGAGMIQFVNE